MNIDHVKDELRNIKEDKSRWYYVGPFDEDTVEQKMLDSLKDIEYEFETEEEYNNLSEAVYLKYYGDDYDIDKASDEVKKLINEIEIEDAGNTCNNSAPIVFEWTTFRFLKDEDETEDYITAISIYEYGDYRGSGYSDYFFVKGDLVEIYNFLPSIYFGSYEKPNECDVFIEQSLLSETGVVRWDYEGNCGEGYIWRDDPDIPAKVRALGTFVLEDHLSDTKWHRNDYVLKEIGPFVFIILYDEIQSVYLDKTQMPGFNEDNDFYSKMRNIERYVCEQLKDIEFNVKDLEREFDILKFDEDEFIAYSEVDNNIVEILKVDLNDISYEVFQTSLLSDDITEEQKDIIRQKHLENVTNSLPNIY